MSIDTNQLEYKIIILGPEGWGKTTMVNYFNNITPELSSDGKVVYKPSINVTNTNINISNVNLNFMDVPGNKEIVSKYDFNEGKKADIYLVFRWYDCIKHVFYEDKIPSNSKIVYLMDYNYFYKTKEHHQDILNNILEICKNSDYSKRVIY